MIIIELVYENTSLIILIKGPIIFGSETVSIRPNVVEIIEGVRGKFSTPYGCAFLDNYRLKRTEFIIVRYISNSITSRKYQYSQLLYKSFDFY